VSSLNRPGGPAARRPGGPAARAASSARRGVVGGPGGGRAAAGR